MEDRMEENNSLPEWKLNNKEYLREIQIFLDKADNIENEKLKEDIVFQMLKCDKVITKLAQDEIEKMYKKKNNI